MRHPLPQRGYTLLFAVLTAALVLGVAVFIADVSRKQFELSSSARDSMYSFYAADSGIECAAEAEPATFSTSTSISNQITCDAYTNSQKFAVIPLDQAPSGVIPTGVYVQSDNEGDGLYGAEFDMGLPDGACADIFVFKFTDTTGDAHSVIQSHGYNICTSVFQPDTTNPSTVERALQLTYD